MSSSLTATKDRVPPLFNAPNADALGGVGHALVPDRNGR